MRSLEKKGWRLSHQSYVTQFQRVGRLSKKGKPWKAPAVKEETVNFLRTADYSRPPGFDAEYLLTHKMVVTLYYLTSDGKLQRCSKSEFAKKLKNLLEEPCLTNVPETSLKTAIVIDFMAYAQKVSIKKMNLVCYEDLSCAPWKTFSSLSKGCVGTDIAFDLYLQQSIMQGERNRRSKLEPIKTNISTIKQQLPVEMGKFWSSANNKVKFRQAFIKWMTSNGQ